MGPVCRWHGRAQVSRTSVSLLHLPRLARFSCTVLSWLILPLPLLFMNVVRRTAIYMYVVGVSRAVALVVINDLCPPSCPVPTVVSARLPLLETISTSLGYCGPSGVVLFLLKSKICFSEFHKEYKRQTLHST